MGAFRNSWNGFKPRSIYTSSFKSSFNKFSFKRSFHNLNFNLSFNKRVNIKSPQTRKWNTYDELKLFSYTSHLAFFMLLPPIIQMYTTKVEVFHDDTLTESSFDVANNGLIIKNINFLDIISGKYDKYDKYDNRISEYKSKNKENTNKIEEITKLDFIPSQAKIVSEFDLSLNNITAKINSNNIYTHNNMNTINNIMEEIIKLNTNSAPIETTIQQRESVNKITDLFFNKLHQAQLYSQEMILLRRLLISHSPTEYKTLTIRQKIIIRYEKSKKNTNSNISTTVPLHKLINISKWLKQYLTDINRFLQVIKILAMNKQTKTSFIELMNNSDDIIGTLKESSIRYRVFDELKSIGARKELGLLTKRLQQ